MVEKNASYNLQPSKIPKDPGVYMMKDSAGKTIYVGKAKNLQNRVRTYFAKNRDYKTQKLVEKIADIEFVVTDTEEEAFLLESNLIKRYRPHYNIELRDQQRYTYLRITDEQYPRLLVARRTRSGKFLGTGKTYGPFTHGTSKLLTIGMLRKSFKVRICKTLPKKACLEYHIGNCDAPCEFESAGKKYAGHMAELQNVLSDGKGMVRYERTLEKMMREASNDSRFEEAIEIRETLRRLQSLKGRQNMERSSSVRDEDYVGILTVGDDAHVMSMRQSNGIIRDRERFSYEEIADNTFSNFLYQYYTTRKVPSIILTNKAPERKITLEKMLSKQSGHAVLIKTPGRGRQRQIMDLVMKNIHIAVSGGVEPAIEEMKKQLWLTKSVSIPSGTSVPGCEDADKCFIPSKVSINAGDTISWTNDDTAVHTTTGGSISTGTTGTFDSGLIQSGVMYEYTFDSAGTFDYFCVVHPWMSGSISVN